jgi:hypothetical protein
MVAAKAASTGHKTGTGRAALDEISDPGDMAIVYAVQTASGITP